VDEHFADYRESLAGLSEPERFLAQAIYAGRAGMMPATLAHEIEGGLLAKDPARLARGIAAVDDERRAGDEAGALGGEVQDDTLPEWFSVEQEYKPESGSNARWVEVEKEKQE
jgi:hypothetical protein